jgi:hypothetical protein
MLPFLTSSTFFIYAQNAGFAFKKFKIFMVGVGMPPNPPSMFEPLQNYMYTLTRTIVPKDCHTF